MPFLSFSYLSSSCPPCPPSLSSHVSLLPPFVFPSNFPFFSLFLPFLLPFLFFHRQVIWLSRECGSQMTSALPNQPSSGFSCPRLGSQPREWKEHWLEAGCPGLQSQRGCCFPALLWTSCFNTLAILLSCEVGRIRNTISSMFPANSTFLTLTC